MKYASLIAKIMTGVAALVGTAYLIATYGDRIVAWVKNLLPVCPAEEDFDDLFTGHPDDRDDLIDLMQSTSDVDLEDLLDEF